MPDAKMMLPAKGDQVRLVKLQFWPHMERFHVMYVQCRRGSARLTYGILFHEIVSDLCPEARPIAFGDIPVDRLALFLDRLGRLGIEKEHRSDQQAGRPKNDAEGDRHDDYA